MDQVKSLATEYKPWRRDLPWWIAGAEGALALGIGLYFVVAPDAANSTVRLLLAALLLVSSAFDILTGFRDSGPQLVEKPMTPFLLVRGGAGVALALLFFLATRAEYVTEDDARYILGYGLIAYAAIGLVGVIAAMIAGQMRWASLAANLLFLLIGAVLIYNRQESVSEERAVRFIGWGAIVGGAILLLYSYFLKKGQERAAAESAAVAGAPLLAEGMLVPAPGDAPSVSATPPIAPNFPPAMGSATAPESPESSTPKT